MNMNSALIAFSAVLLSACSPSQPEAEAPAPSAKVIKSSDVQPANLETAYFASGCFWCVEAVFESVKGVDEVVSGYSGGVEPNPTYRQVSRGTSTHAEAVEVFYDPSVVDFTTLVDVFFASHDPTTLNRQGPDRGPQYRSIAFYKNDKEKTIIESAIEELNKSTYGGKIVTEVTSFEIFYDAEDYHQNYEARHPNNGYVKAVSIPRLNKFKAKRPELLKENAH